MEGLDAPERGMAFYKVSKNYLGNLCLNQEVVFQSSGKDQYSRDLGFTFLSDGREVGHEMIKAGMAWHYKKYNQDEALANAEIEARQERRGLWSDKNPVAPWEIRKRTKKGFTVKEAYQQLVE